jgi:hypothetical protein
MATVILLILLAVAPSARAQGDGPWMFLRDFTVVPGAVSELEDGYVASVFRNSEKGLLALVIYPGVCDPSGCAVQDPVAYLVVDAQGLLVKLHLNPGTKLSSVIAGFHVA